MVSWVVYGRVEPRPDVARDIPSGPKQRFVFRWVALFLPRHYSRQFLKVREGQAHGLDKGLDEAPGRGVQHLAVHSG